MDAIREYLNRPVIAGVAGLVVGLLVGWMVLGWLVFPVKYTNAFPEHLRAGDPFNYREDYLRMAIDSYSQNPDDQLARQRFRGLGVAGPELLDAIIANPGAQGSAAISQFSFAVQEERAAIEEAASAGGSFLSGPLLLICGLTLVLAVAIAFVVYMRQERGGERPAAGVREARPELAEAEVPGEEPPLAQFMTTYMLGDDLFDDSFSIDSPAGEFLGECGVGIAETIGVGEPKRVSSFEVWLFDKNDIQTVTKVLMSAHVFNDEATRQRLAAKGEPVLAEPGTQITLETATLQLVARIVDMSYGEGALPPESFFDRLTLELAVWPVESAAE